MAGKLGHVSSQTNTHTDVGGFSGTKENRRRRGRSIGRKESLEE